MVDAAAPFSQAASFWQSRYQHPCDWDQHYPLLSLPEMVDASIRHWPDRLMLDFLGRKYSYAEVGNGIRRVAAGLQKLGIGKGDHIGLFLPNVPHYLPAYFGALAIGATVVNFSPLYSVDELAHQVENSQTRMLFTLSSTALLPTALEVMQKSRLEALVVGSVAGALPAAKSVFYRMFRSKEIAPRPQQRDVIAFSELIANDGIYTPANIQPAEDVALIQYTGGTTGTPKGAMLTHQAMTTNARQMAAIDPHRAEPHRLVAVLPFFHIFANAVVMNRTILLGGEMVLLPRFDAGQVLAAINRTEATELPGVPTMFRALLEHPKLADTDFTHMRTCLSGGAALPEALKAQFEAATGATVAEGYGLTESGIATVNPYAGINKAGTIGQPLPATHVRLVDREDPTREVAAGEPGEIVIHGPQIMAGYWQRPDIQHVTFADGGVRTGDVGIMDADGYITVVDRLKDMISVGGFKVFPSQIEVVLYKHPAVREAIVVGVPDDYHGEMPKAFVTLKDGEAAEGEALKAWLNPQLGKHERVIAVEIRSELPKTMIGKLSRKELVAEEKEKAARSS